MRILYARSYYIFWACGRTFLHRRELMSSLQLLNIFPLCYVVANLNIAKCLINFIYNLNLRI